jgi:DNA processing protein
MTSSAATAAGPSLPSEAYLVGLARLPKVGPRRLAGLLHDRSPAEAWSLVTQGQAARDPVVAEGLAPDGAELATRWVTVARRLCLDELWAAHLAADIEVVSAGDDRYPSRLVDDPEPPAVLFVRGDLGVLSWPTVAVVGTRRCTAYGREVARDLGRQLAEAGVSVVSGLAMGIDSAAHVGALGATGAPPVGVVANGLDIAYPKRHAALYDEVASSGLLLSEYPLGCQPRRWAFPARNRIVAALSQLVVVVESHEAGGSLYTVDEAIRRDIDVLAVPGPIRSPASVGTNRLLGEGCAPVCDVADILVRLGLATAGGGSAGSPPTEQALREVLDALGWEPALLDHLVMRTAMTPETHLERLARLEEAGHISRTGGWWERTR